MTYIQAGAIMQGGDKYTQREQILAAKKIYKLSLKALTVAMIAEHIVNIIAFVTRWVLWFGGVAAVMVSFLCLAYNTTAEYTVPITDTLKLELLLVIGIISAYIGYQLVERERRKYHDAE